MKSDGEIGENLLSVLEVLTIWEVYDRSNHRVYEELINSRGKVFYLKKLDAYIGGPFSSLDITSEYH